MESRQLAEFCAEKIFEKKGFNVVMLDLRENSIIADYFVIASGNSDRQVVAITEYLVGELRDERLKPKSVEGVQEGKWALIDAGDVIVHVFQDYLREFYDLEGLWQHVPRERMTDKSAEAATSNA